MNGKSLVITSILKLDRPFRPPQIGDITGLSRQLIRHHLLKLLENGCIEKQGKYYLITDKERLLDELLNATEYVSVEKMRGSGFIGEGTAERLNTLADGIVNAHTLKYPMALDARQAMILKIDDTMKDLVRLKKYLTQSQRTDHSALKRLKDVQAGTLYDNWVGGLRVLPLMPREEFINEVESINEDLTNDL